MSTIDDLNVSCWYSYRHEDAYAHWSDPRWIPMVWSEAKQDLTALAQAHPGRYWLLLNEPDNPQQANLTWDVAAQRYATYYQDIKAGDPSAKIGGPNVLYILPDGQTTGHGFTCYSTAFIGAVQAQGGSFDFWGFHLWFARNHNGILGGTVDFAAAERHVGHIHSLLGPIPIWLTEAGGRLGPGHTEADYIADMNLLLDWLNMRGFEQFNVQRVFWFSRFYAGWENSLVDANGNLRGLGEKWRDV